MSVPGRNSQSQVTPITNMHRVTSAERTAGTTLPENARGFICGGTAGLVNITLSSGTQMDNLFVQPGIPYPFAVTAFRTVPSQSNAVTDIVVLY